jgi:putative redox protein
MKAKVTWNGAMSFTGTANSGFTLPLGADASSGGAEDGFRPLELMAISLAACTAMDVVSILNKKHQDVTDFEVKVHADQQKEHPHVFTQADIVYFISGHHVDEAAVARAIELSATRYCPAQAMLAKVIPIGLRYEIYEDNGNVKELVKKGEWKSAPVAE